MAREAIPATDGQSIWLPRPASHDAVGDLQIMAMQQASRALRGAAHLLPNAMNPLVSAIFEVLEADAADAELVRGFPGLGKRLHRFREECLNRRPTLNAFPASRRALETWLRTLLQAQPAALYASTSAQSSMELAQDVALNLLRSTAVTPTRCGRLYRDRWIGALRAPSNAGDAEPRNASCVDEPTTKPIRSARMTRRPEVRKEDERDAPATPGPWMVQTAQPHEHAEDPFGMQRPTDRDEQQAAEGLAESLSDLSEARLVSVPGSPKEILLSDDPPPSTRHARTHRPSPEGVLRYPEWDWRLRAYRVPGAAVHMVDAPHGTSEWVRRTLEAHRALLHTVRRQFESLRAQRLRLRQQPDGDELDLEACLESFADARAGTAIKSGLYQSNRTASRELAVLLLMDVSGSTDGWVSDQRRIIDVEREALLLVCLALDSLGEPYAALAFSGEGPGRVTLRAVKQFSERFSSDIGLRIAGLEPEKYTRAGAAIRHASALLLREPARHRLLLMLSDGKPNDMDEYDGRYGVEDMRQSIVEARLQGVFPFCLTIDRHATSYLPTVFGEHQYAVLHRPELLPTALLGWLRRLVHA